MDEIRKPTLTPELKEEIARAQYVIDKTYWAKLQPLRMTVGDTLAGAGGMPIPPKQPILLSSLLREYSCSLFDAESINYETTPELSDSLRLLAVKIEGRLLRTALHGKDGILRVFIGDLTYHLDEETMT